jgi:hypothetical protein
MQDMASSNCIIFAAKGMDGIDYDAEPRELPAISSHFLGIRWRLPERKLTIAPIRQKSYLRIQKVTDSI